MFQTLTDRIRTISRILSRGWFSDIDIKTPDPSFRVLMPVSQFLKMNLEEGDRVYIKISISDVCAILN